MVDITENSQACILCQLVKGESPVSIVYQDEKILVFPTLEPVNPGHILIIPKTHVAYLSDLEPETAGHIMAIVPRLASAIKRSKYRCEGVNLFAAEGEAAGQDVFHFHLHIYPRYKGDGFGFKYDKTRHFLRLPRAEMDEIAGEIRSHFKNIS
jgi:histidine triad (HIT) family protein